MKFKIEVDEEFAEDEYLEEHIKRNIEDKVSSEVVKRIFNDVYINAVQKISEKVDVFIDEALALFINRRIVVTDNWGNEKETFESVQELLENRFDNFMSGSVDKNGKSVKSGCSYNGNDSRIQHLVDKTATAQIEKFTKDVARIADNRLRALLTKSLKENLNDTIFKNIDVQKLLRGF